MLKTSAPNNVNPFDIIHDALGGKGPDSRGFYQASCPGPSHKNHDKNASLSYREMEDGSIWLNCFTGCERSEILNALNLQERDLHTAGKGYKPKYRRYSASLSLVELASQKLIPTSYLSNYGVTDEFKYTTEKGNFEAVRISYKLRDGSEHTKKRIRYGTSGHDTCFVQEDPGTPIPYGLWKLDEAEKAGYLPIVEGESDTWTCWFHGIPCLGIPGAGMVKALDGKELASIPRLYIIQEPDQVVKAANLNVAATGFYSKMYKQLRSTGYTDKIYYVDFEKLTGYKDPNAMHQALVKNKTSHLFKSLFEEALQKADPAGDESVDEETQSGLQALDQAIQEKDTSAIFRASVLLAQLSFTEYAVYKAKIKDACGKSINLVDLDKAVREMRPQKRGERALYGKNESGMCFFDDEGSAIDISNFRAEIIADVKTDDGAESTRSYALEAEIYGRVTHFEIPAKDFSKCEWVDEHVGARARVTTGQSMKSHLVNAVKYCSEPVERFHYAHTGWRNIDGHMGYLHSGGFLSQVSQVENKDKKDLTQKDLSYEVALQASLERCNNVISHVSHVSQVVERESVRLSGTLVHYEFPDTQGDVRSAIRASLAFLNLASDTIVYPLYSALWRSVLGSVDFGLHLAGQTGWGKSELAALMQQHFGAAMSAHKLPGSWESTENALEMLLFQAKDVLVVVDDFKPKGGKNDQDRLHAKADRVFRTIGNGAGRGRLTSDLKQRTERRPRCLLLSTGEDVPRGESLKARAIVLTMEERITSGDASVRLTSAQKDARSGLYAQAMAGYISWLVPQIETIQAQLADLVASERDQLVIDGHARSNNNTANLALGMKYFLKYACEMGAISSQEAQDYLTRCITALTQVACEASRENACDKPSEQWKQLLIAALSNKSAHLVGVNGECPGSEYGWTKTIRTVEHDGEMVEEETLRGGGPQIGWIDGEDIYLLPAAAYKVVRAMGSATGNEITTLEPTLRKFLAQDKMIASTDLQRSRKTITVRRRLEGSQKDVLHIARQVLYPSDPLTNMSDSHDLLDSEPSKTAPQAGSALSQVVALKGPESSQVVASQPAQPAKVAPKPYREIF